MTNLLLGIVIGLLIAFINVFLYTQRFQSIKEKIEKVLKTKQAKVVDMSDPLKDIT